MHVAQYLWSPSSGWADAPPDHAHDVQLVLTFANSHRTIDPARDAALRRAFPAAVHVFCAGTGQIADVEIVDDQTVSTAVTFARTSVRGVSAHHARGADSADVGRALAAQLPADGLRHVLAFTDGLCVNGSAFARGLGEVLPSGVAVTGGLAADGTRFGYAPVGLGIGAAAQPVPGTVVIVGLYGEALQVGTGTFGGWDVFGPDRLVTRAVGNVLYELDGEPALALYRRYLGALAAELPASGLLFPLSLRTAQGKHGDTRVVRTVLGIDEAAGSVTLAGDLPEGYYVRLMVGNVDRLIDAVFPEALPAAPGVPVPTDEPAASLALLVSCVGRRWVLQQRTEEELESVRDALGPGPTLAGFYSYGELSPLMSAGPCELHNQTMTVTTLAER